MKKNLLTLAAIFAAMTFTACSSSSDNNEDKSIYGTEAMNACTTLGDELVSANDVIAKAQLSSAQESDLKAILANDVDNVIIPTYVKLADAAEDLEATLNGLDVNSLTDAKIEKACEDFKTCRIRWEQSEAFLGGAASDFSIDPTIDSWPLSRSCLLNYFKNGMKESDLTDESVLGFHALEFMLFRNGQPRKAAAFKVNDTYNLFEEVKGSDELKYAQIVCRLLKERTFQLEVAWAGENYDAARTKVVKDAGLSYLTKNGYSFGENLKNAGNTSISTYATLKDAVAQVLSDDEGSCFGIANEVGTAKIGNPFQKQDVSYVESPYSYRSILDFQDNIRSIRNIWYGTIDGTASTSVKSFYNFFRENKSATNTAVINAFENAINKIGAMPSPFVKYVCELSGKTFSEEEYAGEDE